MIRNYPARRDHRTPKNEGSPPRLSRGCCLDLSFAPFDSFNNVFRMPFYLDTRRPIHARARQTKGKRERERESHYMRGTLLHVQQATGRRTTTDPRANFVTDLCDFPCKLSCSPVIMLIKVMTRRVCTGNAAAVMNHGAYRRRRSSHRSERDTATFLSFPTNSWPRNSQGTAEKQPRRYSYASDCPGLPHTRVPYRSYLMANRL